VVVGLPLQRATETLWVEADKHLTPAHRQVLANPSSRQGAKRIDPPLTCVACGMLERTFHRDNRRHRRLSAQRESREYAAPGVSFLKRWFPITSPRPSTDRQERSCNLRGDHTLYRAWVGICEPYHFCVRTLFAGAGDTDTWWRAYETARAAVSTQPLEHVVGLQTSGTYRVDSPPSWHPSGSPGRPEIQVEGLIVPSRPYTRGIVFQAALYDSAKMFKRHFLAVAITRAGGNGSTPVA